jgi:hypothetical protein
MKTTLKTFTLLLSLLSIWGGLLAQDLKPFKDENGKWGYKDNTGKVIITAIYDNARTYSDDGLARVSKDGKWGYVDFEGNEVIALKFDSVDPMKNGLARIKQEGKWGWIDKTGKVIIEAKYDSTSIFENGFAIVNSGGAYDSQGVFVGGKWWMILTTGENISEKYDELYLIPGQNLIPISINKKYGMLDSSGKVVVPIVYEMFSYSCSNGFIGSFVNGFLGVKKDGFWGYIDENGKIIIPTIYDEVHEFKDGYAAVGKGGTILDSLLIELNLSSNNNFKNSKYGFIDKTGKTVIPFDRDGVYWACNHDAGFYGGLAAVFSDGKYGFIDKTGKVVIPFIFDSIIWGTGFMDNFKCGVLLDGREFYIDKNGNEIK